MSSRSEISAIWARQLRSMISSACSRRSGSTTPACMRRTQPKIELSGVRSSCERVERNSFLSRLASSACRRLSRSRSISRACSVTSRTILEAPTTRPCSSRRGESVTETSRGWPSLRRRTVW